MVTRQRMSYSYMMKTAVAKEIVFQHDGCAQDEIVPGNIGNGMNVRNSEVIVSLRHVRYSVLSLDVVHNLVISVMNVIGVVEDILGCVGVAST